MENGKCIICGDLLEEGQEKRRLDLGEKHKGPVHKKCLEGFYPGRPEISDLIGLRC